MAKWDQQNRGQIKSVARAETQPFARTGLRLLAAGGNEIGYAQYLPYYGFHYAQGKMFTGYVTNKAGNITLCAMPSKRRDVEETAAKMSRMPDVERVSVAAYGRIIVTFRGGVRIDSDTRY
jgi:hypothetical protein